MTTARPAIRWSDLRARTVGVWGLGIEGDANFRRLEALGADVVLVDDHPSTSEWSGRPVLSTAGGGLEALGRCEVVVKTPGISRHRPEVAGLVDSGVPVAGGLG
ncbi:MAG TPA: hypothetical protein VHW47_09095, partial [Acidimicrobiales bacterium]|nr:hypothetical protein [Acidimicrobiales bacterium]